MFQLSRVALTTLISFCRRFPQQLDDFNVGVVVETLNVLVCHFFDGFLNSAQWDRMLCFRSSQISRIDFFTTKCPSYKHVSRDVDEEKQNLNISLFTITTKGKRISSAKKLGHAWIVNEQVQGIYFENTDLKKYTKQSIFWGFMNLDV